MPKATSKSTSGTKAGRANPIAKTKAKTTTTGKDPKLSRLYTDDNPETTLHGTGFKDADAARRTIQLVSKRSLTYQFQTINTMYFRARHHPSKTADMEAAIGVFQTWLKETYPREKAGMRVFKPLLSKKLVRQFLDELRSTKGVDTQFAEVYVDLEARKRLANTLVDDKQPGAADWDRARYDQLCELVPEGDEGHAVEEDDLRETDGQPSQYHLKLIAWAWSPLSERKLAAVAAK